MIIIHRFKVISFFLIAAYLLTACGGTLPSAPLSSSGSKGEAAPVAFTGVVESMNGSQWTVSGQPLTLDPKASLDPNIAVGDTVKIEANVSADGTVVAKKVESSNNDHPSAAASVDDKSVPLSTSSSGANSPADSSSAQGQPNSQAEVSGAVESMTADTITINGVTYNLASFTEVKDTLAVGDEVKLHVNVNADGTFTVREIEKLASTTVEDNSTNSNGSNDGPTHDANDDKSSSSGNGTDDGANHDSNDDHGGSGGNSGSGGG